jgi:hypothetical protein
MKLYEKYATDVMTKFAIVNERIEVTRRVINEDSDLTYHELRGFVALLMKTVSDKGTKSTLNDILYALGKLEVMGKPAPTIRKLKSNSPKVFQ